MSVEFRQTVEFPHRTKSGKDLHIDAEMWGEWNHGPNDRFDPMRGSLHKFEAFDENNDPVRVSDGYEVREIERAAIDKLFTAMEEHWNE